MATHNITFASLDLNEKIAKAIDTCGYTTPTPIQAQSIPAILEKKDVVACAQTGSGKTAAFVLPALNILSEQGPSKKTRILILTPTRELASQITKAARMYGKFLSFNIVNLVGGMPYHHQIKDLARGADIIVATPGRLLDHIEQGRVDLSGIQMLVLDEADRMLDMGFIDDVQYIAKLTPSARQTLLFSATIGKGLANIVKALLKHPVKIDLSAADIAAPQIKQVMYRVSSMHQKNRLLKHLLVNDNIFKAIIFTATKINADKLADQLRDDGLAAAALHGDLRQNVRNRTVEQLRSGKTHFLVATDVAARGIDISDVTHVINYDLPRFNEDYVHRIGRTGRAGKTGIAISFVGPTDSRHLKNIERYLGQHIKEASIDRSLLTGGGRQEATDFHDDDGDGDSDGGRKPHGRSKPRFSERSFERDDKPKSAGRNKKPFKDTGRDYSFARDKKPTELFSSKNKSRFEKSERDDKPKRQFSSEGKRSFGDRERSFDRSDKPKGKFGGESKRRFNDTERSFDRSDKPKRKFGGEGKRRFDDSERSFNRDDEPKRNFRGEGKRRFGDDSERSFDRSDKPKRKFGGGENKRRSDDNDRSFDRSDKPKRKFGSEGKRRFDDNDRSFNRGDKTKRKFGDSNKSSRKPSTAEKKRFDNVGGKAVESSEGVRAFKKRSITKVKKFGNRR